MNFAAKRYGWMIEDSIKHIAHMIEFSEKDKEKGQYSSWNAGYIFGMRMCKQDLETILKLGQEKTEGEE